MEIEKYKNIVTMKTYRLFECDLEGLFIISIDILNGTEIAWPVHEWYHFLCTHKGFLE